MNLKVIKGSTFSFNIQDIIFYILNLDEFLNLISIN